MNIGNTTSQALELGTWLNSSELLSIAPYGYDKKSLNEYTSKWGIEKKRLKGKTHYFITRHFLERLPKKEVDSACQWEIEALIPIVCIEAIAEYYNINRGLVLELSRGRLPHLLFRETRPWSDVRLEQALYISSLKPTFEGRKLIKEHVFSEAADEMAKESAKSPQAYLTNHLHFYDALFGHNERPYSKLSKALRRIVFQESLNKIEAEAEKPRVSYIVPQIIEHVDDKGEYKPVVIPRSFGEHPVSINLIIYNETKEFLKNRIPPELFKPFESALDHLEPLEKELVLFKFRLHSPPLGQNGLPKNQDITDTLGIPKGSLDYHWTRISRVLLGQTSKGLINFLPLLAEHFDNIFKEEYGGNKNE